MCLVLPSTHPRVLMGYCVTLLQAGVELVGLRTQFSFNRVDIPHSLLIGDQATHLVVLPCFYLFHRGAGFEILSHMIIIRIGALSRV